MTKEAATKQWEDSFYFVLFAIAGIAGFNRDLSAELIGGMGIGISFFWLYLRQKQKVWLLLTVILLGITELRRAVTVVELDWSLANMAFYTVWWAVVLYYGYNCYRLYRLVSVTNTCISQA